MSLMSNNFFKTNAYEATCGIDLMNEYDNRVVSAIGVSSGLTC